MDRRTYIEGLGTVAATGALAGCTGNGNGAGDGDGSSGTDDTNGDDDDSVYGILSTSVTDQPNDIDHFESLVVTIDGIWVKPDGTDEEEDEDSAAETDDETDGEDSEPDSEDEAETDGETADQNDDSNDDDDSNDNDDPDDDDDEAGDVDQSSGRYYIEFEEPQEADLVGLQGADTQLIDETELAVGEYQFLQLDIAGTNGVLTDGEAADVETPGNAPLQFKHAFDIRPEGRTRFIADFAPFQIGQGQRYRIRPVATGTQVLYGDEEYDGGDDEGDTGNADEDDASDDSGNDADDSDGSPDDAE